jgi:hypothetical protein
MAKVKKGYTFGAGRACQVEIWTLQIKKFQKRSYEPPMIKDWGFWIPEASLEKMPALKVVPFKKNLLRKKLRQKKDTFRAHHNMT